MEIDKRTEPVHSMRPPASSWLRRTVTKWAMRFLYRQKPPIRTTTNNSATLLNLKEVKIRSVRADWVAVSAEGVGVGIIKRPSADECRVVTYHGNPIGPAVRLLALCHHPARMTPADFGLESLIMERGVDNVKIYFGPHDNILGTIAAP